MVPHKIIRPNMKLMASMRLIGLWLVIGFFVTVYPATAMGAATPDNCNLQKAFTDSVATSSSDVIQERDSIFPQGSRPLWLSNFPWGVDVGASIDLRGYDMSTFDLDVMIGYKSEFIRTIGIGAGVHRSFGKKNNFIPLYFVFRSSFRSKPSLFFFNMRAGYAFSTIADGASRGGVMAAMGVGINLAMSKKFQSHILLSYCYYHINRNSRSEVNLPSKYVDLARISFGVNF